jgi:hypothetical protein
MATGAVAGTSMMDGNPYFEVMINGNALLPGTETASFPYFLLMKRGTMPRQARDKREVNSKKERFVSFHVSRFTFQRT